MGLILLIVLILLLVLEACQLGRTVEVRAMALADSWERCW